MKRNKRNGAVILFWNYQIGYLATTRSQNKNTEKREFSRALIWNDSRETTFYIYETEKWAKL